MTFRRLVVILAGISVALTGALAIRSGAPLLAASEIRVLAEAGPADSVRFRAQFTTPAVQLDSITLRWSLTGNNNVNRVITPPPSAQITDAVLFRAAPTPGGATYGGSLIVTSWKGGASTPVVKNYNVNVPDTGPPPAVVGLVLLDSAVVINP